MPSTEDTLNDLVADYLRSNFDIDITTQTSGRTPSGNRKPDFELHHLGKVFYGEGEWLSSYLNGLVQAIDFGDIPGASGYFLLGYPDDARNIVSSRRTVSSDPTRLLAGLTLEKCLFKMELKRADVRRVEIGGLSDWINAVLSTEVLPPQSDEFKNLMRSVVDSLTNYLPTAKGGARLFEHIIATIPQERDEEETARRGSAYLLLNQLVFHRILASHPELKYEKMDPEKINGAPDIQARFDEVMDQDYRAIFKTNVIDLFPPEALPFIRSLIKLISHLKPEEFTRDLLGSIFHTLIPLQVRQPVAAYYTNEWAARLLAFLAEIKGTDRVADFACGSGSLLVAAYERKAETDSRPNDQARHASYLENEITGMDIMPFAAHLAVVQLALLNPLRWTNKVRVAVEDSTEYSPGDPVRSLERRAISPQRRITTFGEDAEQIETVKRGATSADGTGNDFMLDYQDAVIMNPPFTRKQFIKREYRDELTSRFPEYSKYLNREIGFYGYFVALADRFLADNGKLALVVPAALLRQASMSGIRALLRERYMIKYILMSSSRSAFSEDTQIREMLLVATKTNDRSHPARTATIKTALNEGNIEWIRRLIDGDERADDVQSREVPQSAFETEDWLSLVPGTTIASELLTPPRDAPLTSLRSLRGVGLIQGIRMEKGSEFVNSSDTLVCSIRESSGKRTGPLPEWAIIGRETNSITVTNVDRSKELVIPLSALAPATRTLSSHTRLLVTEPPDFAVVQRFKGDKLFWNSPDPNRILIERRRHVKSRTGRVVFAGYGNIDLNGSGTSLLAIACNPPLAPTWNCWVVDLPTLEDAKILTIWWNSSFNLEYLLRNRIEIRGSVTKWRKPTLLNSSTFDTSKLTEDERKLLLTTFDELAAVDFPSLAEQFGTQSSDRLKLDLSVGKVIGFDKSELRSLLSDFYVTITNELNQMMTMMKGDSKNHKTRN